MVGIVSYGTYIPSLRIKLADIAKPWKREEKEVLAGLGVIEKSVAGHDEDAVTLSVAAAENALQSGNLTAKQIEAFLIGSESHPYAVKPTSTIVGEILGSEGNYFASDLEFACKAGTAGIILMLGLVGSGKISYGMAIGADTAQAKPGDILECTAGSGAAAFVLGKQHIILEIVEYTSYSSDTPDFWRRDGQKYPSHAARFTGEPAYFHHVETTSLSLLKKAKMKPADFDYAIFHMPNGKFPKVVARELGFTPEQLKPGFVVEQIGNPYSASSLVGLAATLDIAKPGQTIFLCSYGSGAGSDAFVLRVTKEILALRKRQKSFVVKQITNKQYIDYMELYQRQIIKNSL